VRHFSIVAAALLVTGCAGTHGKAREVPVPLSDQHERIIGSRIAKRFETGLKPELDPKVNDYVNQLCQRIARLSDRPEIPYTVRVFVSEDPRAVAFPGGMIYVSTGLLQRVDTESEVAGVLGHEIAHVALRHPSGLLERGLDDVELAAILSGPRGADTTAAGAEALRLLSAGYGRDAESKADVTSLLYLSRAGIDPKGMIEVMEKLNPARSNNYVFWEPLSGGNSPPVERIASLHEEVRSMGLDAGLARDMHPYAPVKRLLK
jgi:predicted Zn-dependent protease